MSSVFSDFIILKMRRAVFTFQWSEGWLICLLFFIDNNDKYNVSFQETENTEKKLCKTSISLMLEPGLNIHMIYVRFGRMCLGDLIIPF